MATTSTIVTVKKQLVTKFTTALATAGTGGGQVPVTYAWPGPDTASECVFLGPHPQTADVRVDDSQQIPTIKAGRKQRQEEYTVRATVWSFRPDLTATGAETCEARAFVLLGHLEDELADDPRIGLAPTVVQWLNIEAVLSTLFPFQAGWANELSIDIAVKARLT